VFYSYFAALVLDLVVQCNQQIKGKGYAKPYLGLGQPIHQIGVELNKASRSVVGLEVEML
jgi:hypothetical protein